MREFKIKEGNHSFGLHIFGHPIHFKPFFGKKLVFCAEFSPNCLYDFPGEDPDQQDINKLFGFSRGKHHKNSARIGWNCKDGKIQLFSYCYINSKCIKSESLLSIDPNEKVCCTIKDAGTNWYIKIQTALITKKVNVPKLESTSIGVILFPYFGGNEVAPHDMNITIDIQK